MINSDSKLGQSKGLQSSLVEIERKLTLIDVKLALQSTVIPSGTQNDEIFAKEQQELLDYQEDLLAQAYNTPISEENKPGTFLKLWRRYSSTPEDYLMAEMLAVKVHEHYTSQQIA